MTRVLEIVLALPLPSGGVTTGRRRGTARAVRDFGAELVRAWRICPPVRMKRGHESIAITPLALAEALPHASRWRAWRETGQAGERWVAVQSTPFAPGVAIREMLLDETQDAEAAADDGSLAAELRRVLREGSVPAHAMGAGADPAESEASERPTQTPAADAFGFDCERRRGRWQREDRVPVDLTLDDLGWRGEQGAGRACELRLAVDYVDDDAGRELALRSLFDAARELSGAWPAFLKPASLLDLACAGVPPDAERGPVRADPVDLAGMRRQREALFAFGANVVAQWLGNDAGVRDSSDPEYVHQMRIALRRLRTLMRLFRDYADEAYREAFAADLSWFGAQLGVVRDWDVCVSETLPRLAEADTDVAGAPAWAATLEAAARQREVARGELRQALGSSRYARLVLGWVEWLCLLSLRGEQVATRRQRRALRRHAARRVDKLFARVYGAPDLATLDAAARHRVRIDAKRLRYALEFFASIASQDTRRKLIKRVSEVQGTLGDANDVEVALRHLERLAAPPEQLGFARGYGAAAQHYATIAAEAQLRKLWRPKLRG
ncbi:CHAD domain-containing protein [Burkholderia gladioli]|uniref:CHAD domain-containing protein n=1 Tax=Burkholderia gladioli TaxID=28095 RepID=UPI001640A4BE|nr:CHAD domain-containing protein [Burkholderia gladioli]